jgi:hypothetical protein
MPNKEPVTIVVRWVKVVDVHGEYENRALYIDDRDSNIIITTLRRKTG